MSRFSSMQRSPLRLWSPPESPWPIRYTAGLLRQIRIASVGGDTAGILFGTQQGKGIRLVAARRAADDTDPRLAGLKPLGVFVSRVRGKVFLTESDLEKFDQLDGNGVVALVVAGTKGGFFVREADGSMQTIRSYEEFSLLGDAATPARPKPSLAKWPGRIASVCAALLTISLLLTRAFMPHPPIVLTLREDSGQLRIAWNLRGPGPAWTLEIVDGGERTAISIPPGQSSATYARKTGDVRIRLNSRESARFLGSDPSPSEIDRARSEIKGLETEINELRAQIETGRNRLTGLQAKLLQGN